MDLQAEYDNGAKVPDYRQIVSRWEQQAADFRATHPQAVLDLPYGDSERQRMDIFPASPDAPIALFIHGGYWQRMHRHVFSHFATGLLAHGIGVAIPSYDLCPQVGIADIAEQMRRATALLARRTGRRLLVTGHSAGGHLAAMLLATDWTRYDLPAGTVAAALPISGLFDLPPLRHTTIADPLGLDEAEAHRLSPMFLPSPNLPIHAVVGGDEGQEYTRQSRGIAEAWGGTWESLPNHNHFTIAALLTNPDSPLTRRAVAMMP